MSKENYAMQFDEKAQEVYSEVYGGGSGLDIIELSSDDDTLTNDEITRYESGAWFEYENCILTPSGSVISEGPDGPIIKKYFSSTIGDLGLDNSMQNAFYKLEIDSEYNYTITILKATVTSN